MTGELPSDPYCHRKLREANAEADEEALFEVWFNLDRVKRWRALYGNDPMPDDWGEGFKDLAKNAWLSRASLHVTQGGPIR